MMDKDKGSSMTHGYYRENRENKELLCECGDILTSERLQCLVCECRECGCLISLDHCGHFDCGACSNRFSSWDSPL